MIALIACIEDALIDAIAKACQRATDFELMGCTVVIDMEIRADQPIVLKCDIGREARINPAHTRIDPDKACYDVRIIAAVK